MKETIDVDTEVLEALGQRARPFIDTEPNDVLRRLLGLDEDSAGDESQRSASGSNGAAPQPARNGRRRATGGSRRSAKGGKRAPKGSLLDERAYWIPILQALEEHGGRAAAREAVERVGQLVDDQLTPLDREALETGGVRWQTRVQFARLRMKKQELLNPDSPRGVWEITDKGREQLRQSAAATIA